MGHSVVHNCQIRVIIIHSRQGDITSISTLFCATCSNVAQRAVACEDGRYINLDAAQLQPASRYSLLLQSSSPDMKPGEL